MARLRAAPLSLAVGLALILPFAFIGLFPGMAAPHGPTELVDVPLLAPSRRYLLGTDELGRDILSRVIYGGRHELMVSLSAALAAAVVGSLVGLVIGYLGGRVDATGSRLVEVLLAFPAIILALFLLTIFGQSSWVQILAIATVMIPSMIRLTRGIGLTLRSRPFVEASRIAGASRTHILVRHLVPNALATILVAVSVLAASSLLIAASLSYLGLGVALPDPSWGNLLKASYGSVFDSPLYGVAPGLCITLVALAYTLIGNGFRVVFARRQGFVVAKGAGDATT